MAVAALLVLLGGGDEPAATLPLQLLQNQALRSRHRRPERVRLVALMITPQQMQQAVYHQDAHLRTQRVPAQSQENANHNPGYPNEYTVHDVFTARSLTALVDVDADADGRTREPWPAAPPSRAK